ncbi:MAG: P-loop NTPase fold protein, partial [Bosea sp. (in: a-proteobacteria)]
MDRNEHVTSYLKYYVEFVHPPRFAVLLNGKWGIGKTFFIKQFLESLGPEIRSVYVSLYGLSSLDAIDDALLRAIYPALDYRSVRFVGQAIKAAVKVIGGEVDAKPSDVLKPVHADLFVFDDLERCDVPVNQVLGYINGFIEHEGRKVVIVANEIEIVTKEAETEIALKYGRIREKLVGKTLELRSSFEQARQVFLAAIDDEKSRRFFAEQDVDLAALYKQSGLENLRILQQSMWDFERLYREVTDKHRGNKPAIGALLRLLLALSFEIKSGRLTEADLQNRHSKFLAARAVGSKEVTSSPIAAAHNRYPSAEVLSTMLSDETLTDVLVRGIVDGGRIRAELDASSYFVTVADEPAWRTVWHAFERTEAQFETAFEKMEQAFARREFEDTGEILHVFGLRLWSSETKVLDKTRAEIAEECRAYVDDLFHQHRIEPTSRREDNYSMRFDGYGGLSIQQSETPEYAELYAYLKEKRRQAAVAIYPEAANEVMVLLKDDTDAFFRAISLDNGADNCYCDVPILAALEPSIFVNTLLMLDPARQRVAFIALQSRYKHGNLDRKLEPERAWAEEVRNKFLSATADMSNIGKYRIKQLVNWYLDGALG